MTDSQYAKSGPWRRHYKPRFANTHKVQCVTPSFDSVGPLSGIFSLLFVLFRFFSFNPLFIHSFLLYFRFFFLKKCIGTSSETSFPPSIQIKVAVGRNTRRRIVALNVERRLDPAREERVVLGQRQSNVAQCSRFL